jgi:ribosomal protein S13
MNTGSVVLELQRILGDRISFGECWRVGGRGTRNGYARARYAGRDWQVHRISWVLANGPIPDGKMILHTCRTRDCCRPTHLYVGDAKANIQDAIRDGTHFSRYRGITHCKRGHPLYGPNLMVYTTKAGQRMRRCRECDNARRRKPGAMQSAPEQGETK